MILPVTYSDKPELFWLWHTKGNIVIESFLTLKNVCLNRKHAWYFLFSKSVN